MEDAPEGWKREFSGAQQARARFKRWVALVAGIAFGLLCVRLGFWQLSRADEKRALAAQIDAATVMQDVAGVAALQLWQHVRLHGHWLGEQSVFLDNQVRHEQAGFDVLTPFVLDNGGGSVLVDRGWLQADRNQLPDVPTPTGALWLSGWVRKPPSGGLRLGNGNESGRIWLHADPAQFSARGLSLAPWLILQESVLRDQAGSGVPITDDGLLREWPRPDVGVEMHNGYALQWFSFGSISFGLVAWSLWRRRQNQVRSEA